MEEKLNVTKRLFILLNLLDEESVFYSTEVADILGVDVETVEEELDFFCAYLVKKVNGPNEAPAFSVIKR